MGFSRPTALSTSVPARRRGSSAFPRNQIFARAPLWVRGLLYFFLRYFLRLGFLDGPEGFVFHFLQGLCNWILIDAKIDEARRFMALRGLEAFKAYLKSRHGIDHVPAAPRSDAVAI